MPTSKTRRKNSHQDVRNLQVCPKAKARFEGSDLCVQRVVSLGVVGV